MHVTDTGGDGPTVVFLHGNPTSSYLWRHVIAALAARFRCITIDLIGMGASAKPPITYDWSDHRRYLTPVLNALLDPLPDRLPGRLPDGLSGPLPDRSSDRLGGAWLVGHDWGAALAVEYARTHPGRVSGVALTEGHLRPLASWDAFDEGGRDLFQRLRDPIEGRRLIEDDNFFLSTVLPSGMLHELTAEEQAAYAAPHPTPQSRHPIWKWVTQIPIAGDPPETHQVLTANWEWLTTTDVPRLLLTATPGAIIDEAKVNQIRQAAPTVRIRNVGEGLHFLPEDRPQEIAIELAAWITSD